MADVQPKARPAVNAPTFDGGSLTDDSGRDSAPGEARPAQAPLPAVDPSMTNSKETTTVMHELAEAGPDYCRNHHGIREEDEDGCDNADEDGCPACGGDGFEGEDDECPECAGTGVTPCDLTPLLYEPRMGERHG